MAWSRNDNPLEHLARFGYGARGFVFCVVGGLALLAAFGQGGSAGDGKGAIRAVLGGPFGVFLVGAIAIGLAGFALWRLVESLTDADHHGTSPKALVVRAGHLVSAVVYAGLAATAANLAFGIGRASSGGDGVRDGTAWLLSQPFGPWLVAFAGLCVLGAGIGYGVKAWTGKVDDHLALPAGTGAWILPMGRFGFAARCLVFLLIGGFILTAAWTQASSEARGLSGAFAALRAQPYGWALLAIAAAGHFAFGAFGLVQARYRRIDAPDVADAGDAVRKAARSLK